jgi:DNA-directed RNA polymerase specialized sigma24 family protein
MLSKLVEDNYKQLLINAKHITRRNPRHQAEALISEAYIKLANKEVKEEGFVKVFTKTMHYLYIGTRSTFNKAEKLSPLHLTFDNGNDDWKQIELVLDNVSDGTRELINELSHLKEQDAVDYVDLMCFKHQLPPHLKEIFSLHYEQGLGCRKIAQLMEEETGYKMSYMGYHRMIMELNNKLYGSN